MQRDRDRPHMVPVEQVIDETPTVRTLVFTDDIMSSARPGQFSMVWIPGVGELPMSVMVRSDKDRAAFTVRRHGPASTGLYNTKVGQLIGVRGPYGNSFEVAGERIMLVGGGTGLVPLMRLASSLDRSKRVTVVMGSKSADEVLFEVTASEMLTGADHDIVVVTEDGSRGRHGLVTDAVGDILGQENFDAVYTCGPEPMMYKTVKLATARDIFVQASLERVMKCGVGICGSCCAGRYLVCRDGTIFDGRQLLQNPEFGHIYRNKAGTVCQYL